MEHFLIIVLLTFLAILGKLVLHLHLLHVPPVLQQALLLLNHHPLLAVDPVHGHKLCLPAYCLVYN